MKMFKLFAIVACVGALFCVTGCGSNSPDGVVLDFLKTAQAGKLDQAYLESHLAGYTETLAARKKELGDKQKEFDAEVKLTVDMFNEMGKKKFGNVAKFTVVDTKIDGDKATVTVKYDKDGKEEKGDFPVKKVNDKWMVNIK